jgi:hypothetical protein
MDSSSLLYAVPVALLIAVVTLLRMGVFGKKPLPVLPEGSPLPVAELTQYYEVSSSPLTWERVRGWELNQVLMASSPPPIDHVVLTGRLLDFCSASSGKLTLVFNFLVGAIQKVSFEPGVPTGMVGPGQGLVTVYTPSGQTRLIATQHFALTLERAIASAHAVEHGG